MLRKHLWILSLAQQPLVENRHAPPAAEVRVPLYTG